MVRYMYLGKVGGRFFWIVNNGVYSRASPLEKPRYHGTLINIVRSVFSRGVRFGAALLGVSLNQFRKLVDVLLGLVPLAEVGAEVARLVLEAVRRGRGIDVGDLVEAIVDAYTRHVELRRFNNYEQVLKAVAEGRQSVREAKQLVDAIQANVEKTE